MLSHIDIRNSREERGAKELFHNLTNMLAGKNVYYKNQKNVFYKRSNYFKVNQIASTIIHYSVEKV